MKLVVMKATPAAIAVLKQATAISPKREKASDGLLPSRAHIKQNPNSDHNLGLAADLTHDPKNGIDCCEIYEKLKQDRRVAYLIFQGKIFSNTMGERKYTGSNPHNKHLHISIFSSKSNDVRPWFPWLGKPKSINKIKAKLSRAKKKKPSPKED